MDKALGYLSLAARAGKLTVGAEECGRELRRRGGGLLVSAADASEGTAAQARAMCAGGRAELLPTAYAKGELAQAIGRETPVALVLLRDRGLAAAFRRAVQSDREQEERE